LVKRTDKGTDQGTVKGTVKGTDRGTVKGTGELEWRRLDRDGAIHALFRDEAAGLVRLGYCLVGDRDLAEDAVQEAFIGLYRNWNQVRDRASLRSYLRAAVINQCRTAQRRLVRARVLRERLSRGLAGSPDGDAVASDDALRVFALVKRLPQRQREVVVCRYYLDLSEAQTAALLELEVGTVKRHGHRAIGRLQREMEAGR
jgi:RNA polymerase sigma factor (sigma-70 family)